MKIPPKEAERFLKSPPPNIIAVLIYGPDSGQVAERGNKLAQVANKDAQDDPFSLVDMDFDRYKEDPTILADEMAAISLMGGRKVIKIKNAAPTALKEMKQALTEPKGDGFVIITAGDLAPKSTLRQLFEKQENLAAVACYKDEGFAIKSIINSMLIENQKNCDANALQYMQHYIMGDRLVIRNEVNKLLLYIGDKNQITLDDVMAVISNNSESSLDELCNAVASGSPLTVEKVSAIMEQEGINAHASLRALQRYFTRLHYVKSLVEQGKPEPEAIKQLRPPVFFKQADTFRKNLRSLSLKKITRILAILLKAEQSTKKQSNAVDVIHKQAVSIVTRQSM